MALHGGGHVSTVDQPKIRRARTGLIAHDPALARPGDTLFVWQYADQSLFEFFRPSISNARGSIDRAFMRAMLCAATTARSDARCSVLSGSRPRVADTPTRSRRFAMRHIGHMAALLIVAGLVVPCASSGQAPQFYAGTGSNMFRVFGCPALQTLTINGSGPTQQGECTSEPNGSTLGPAVPVEAWVATQVSGATRAQNEKLQQQVDELTARVQALEAALSRSRPGAAPK
jgi:hypothetical protein